MFCTQKTMLTTSVKKCFGKEFLYNMILAISWRFVLSFHNSILLKSSRYREIVVYTIGVIKHLKLSIFKLSVKIFFDARDIKTLLFVLLSLDFKHLIRLICEKKWGNHKKGELNCTLINFENILQISFD